jgi:hypothetical protein
MPGKPKRRTGRKGFSEGKYTRPNSPYQFVRLQDQGGWLITMGVSAVCIASGPDARIALGMNLYRQVVSEWHARKAKNMPIKGKRKMHSRAAQVVIR